MRSHPHAVRIPSVAAMILAALVGCSHATPLQVAPAPPVTAKRTTAWEDSVVLSQMAADRRAAEAAKAAADRAIAAQRDALGKMTFFSFDQAVLSEQDKATLDAKIPVLLKNPSVQVQIAGNCDERGSETYNLALGQRRAAAAKRYLVDHGVDGSRIAIISYGLEKPIAKGDTEQSWAMNRNDQFVIIAGSVRAQSGTD